MELSKALKLPSFEPGSVWIAGAGPGDPGLLTALALHGLAAADVLVYDALVSPEILQLARHGARRIHVGKRRGQASARQSDIEEVLVSWARAGYRVLRLKGGDPFVFGRGGEEALALRAAGIAYRIVPGVTAGIGGLAYAGIPVTQRGLNNAVTFVTGHGSDGVLPDDLDWPALARSRGAVVLYMGLRTLPEIATRLLAAGAAPGIPVAVVSEATTARQQVLRSTLGDCTLAVARTNPKAPAIIVIGQVAALHDVLDWHRIDLAAAPDERRSGIGR